MSENNEVSACRHYVITGDPRVRVEMVGDCKVCALEAQLAEANAKLADAGTVLGNVCLLSVQRPGEVTRTGTPEHAAIVAMYSVLEQRDAAIAREEKAEAALRGSYFGGKRACIPAAEPAPKAKTCQNCGKEVAEEGTCPYSEEINDTVRECVCCKECRQNCMYEI